MCDVATPERPGFSVRHGIAASALPPLRDDDLAESPPRDDGRENRLLAMTDRRIRWTFR